MKTQSVNRYLFRHSVGPLIESPGSAYLAGTGLAIIACGATLALLLGALSL